MATNWTDSWKGLKPQPCMEAWDWAKTQPDWQTAWANCPRPDWMLFRLGRGLTQDSPAHRKFALLVIQCAKTSLPYAGDYKSALEAIYAQLERWANGDNAIDLWAAASAAYAAYDAARAAWAASAAYDAAYGAASAASAASAAYDAAIRGEMCSIIRSNCNYPVAP